MTTKITRKRSKIERICEFCHLPFTTDKKGKFTARFCCRSHASFSVNSRPEIKQAQKERPKKLITKECLWCHEEFTFHSRGEKKNSKRLFCKNSCAAKWRMDDPKRKEISRDVATKYLAHSMVGRKRPDASERMKRMNQDEDFITKSKIGFKKWSKDNPTFLSRGGNGKLTIPQKTLSAVLNWEMEVAIKTSSVKDQFNCLPTHYKVDIGNRELKIAIEVDGRSHTTKKWKFLDKRKESVLLSMGWSVLRFWNKEVMDELDRVVNEINDFVKIKTDISV